MNRRLPLKDTALEARIMLRRSLVAAALVGVASLVLVARLVYLQVYSYGHFTTLSDDNRVKLQPVPPTRGLIYDRNGVVVAENVPSFQLQIVPEQVDDLERLLADLGREITLSEEDIARFHRARRRARSFAPVPLRFSLDDREVARLAAIRHRLPGVEIAATLSRRYPLGETMAHVVGYVGRLDEEDLQRLDANDYRGTTHTGKIGVEREYETLLHGHVGNQQVETNALGRVLRVLDRPPPEPGEDLYLSIDSRLQRVAVQALGDRDGAVVAIEVETGEVLVLASTPGYAPNPFVNGIGVSAYRALRTDPDRPLFNRALLGQYPPGSTLKPFVGLAGLVAGVNAREEQFCPGYYVLPGEERRFRDWKRSGHGRVDLDAAITQSCDVYFYALARRLGIDTLHDFLARFGFGAPTGIDMDTEGSGLLPSRRWKRARLGQAWFPGETLNAGIGQGFVLTTPLQLADATATLARRGRRLRPHILHARAAADAAPVPVPPEPLVPVDGIDASAWDAIITAMQHVVEAPHGTARRLRNRAYTVAGKTGTAQVFGIKQDEEYEAEDVAERLRDHALFVAFAPVESPRISIAVVVENGGSGGAVAAPVARAVLDAYFGVPAEAGS